MKSLRPIEAWSDHDLSTLEGLGFERLGRVEDGVHEIAVLVHREPETLALLYEGTPHIELHSVLGRGFAAVTTDAPLRVDEFGEHQGRRERPGAITEHRFVPAAELLDLHRGLVEELRSARGEPRPAGREALERRIRDLKGKRPLSDYRGLLLIASIFVGTIALAIAALAYFD